MGEAFDRLFSTRLAVVAQSPDREDLIARALAAAEGGIELLAFPVSVPSVAEIAAEVADAADVAVGLCDVFTADQLNLAFAAGAEFVVSPIFDADLIEMGEARGVDVLGAVATPNELFKATRRHAGALAIAPAEGFGGPGYVGRLALAFPETPIVAHGGVGLENAPHYLEHGAAAVVVDTGLFPVELDPEANSVISVRSQALVELCAGAVVGQRQSMS